MPPSRLLAGVAAVVAAVTLVTGAGAATSPNLGKALRAGGLVLVLRHAHTDQSKQDDDPVVVSDCTTQRNLSAQGRADARAIGRGTRRLNLPAEWGTLRTTSAAQVPRVREYRVPAGSHPHDVAPAADGTVWYTAQLAGALGRLDPKTGKTTHVPLGDGSAPHGVIVGPDGAPWITDGGLNAIVRVDPQTLEVKRFPLPASSAFANLNTATFDRAGVLWFTGQSGIYGRLEPESGALRVFRAPGGNFTEKLVGTAWSEGMASLYWQVDPRDWDHKKDPSDPAHIARVVASVQRYTKPGSIVLSHDNGQPDTIEAYRTLLPWLKERFELAPLPA